ncbi:MAG TPA: PAS domain S-box protein [Pyrinomonadaceae bacterium]|nr:PAS domain S-box protein [Pyrinomonadaceae bacterium]
MSPHDAENPASQDNSTSHVDGDHSAENSVESIERLRAITDAMPGLISYIDAEYRYQFVNHAYTDWFGLDPKNIIQKPLWEVLGQAAFENLKPHIDTALAGKSEIFETEIDYRLGGTRYIRASYTPDIRDGEVRGLFVLVVDISEERRAREAVRRSEERYRAFIKQSTEGIWRFELDEPIDITLPTSEQVRLAYKHGYLAECNDAMAKQYGFAEASDIIGARLADLLVEDDPKNVEFLSAFIESNYHLSEAESHERDADGTDRYFLNNFVGIVEDNKLIRAWGTQRDVTAAKLADEATARLAAIVLSSDDGIISKDLNGNITSWNIGAERIFGYAADEVIGKSIAMLMPDERVSESKEILRRIRREESVEHFETLRRRKDGRDVIVSLSVSPIRNSDGVVIGASKIVRDITERKRIEETIYENQLMLTLAMQSSKMGVWELDLATNTVSWSEELEDIFGLPKDSFGGTEEAFFALIHEDDRAECWNIVRNAIDGNREYTIEFRFLHSSGTYRWMEGRGKAVYSQTGQPVRVYGIGIDITNRKESEKALRESERRFSRFMQHLPGLAWIKDVDGRYIYANESAERSFGVSGDALYGKIDEEIFPAETAEHFRTHDRRAMDSAGGIQIVESMVEADGFSHHRVVNKFPIAGADGKPALIGGIAIDITDQKHAEEALRRSEETYRTLFESIDEGFCIAEVLFDETGRATDYRFEQANPAFFVSTGFPNDAVGMTARALVPDLEQYWIDMLGNVAKSGQPIRFENEASGIDRWFDIFVSRIGEANENRVAVVFSDITDRKRREANLAFLADWQMTFSPLLTVDEIARTAGTMIADYLRLNHCVMAELDGDLRSANVLYDKAPDGIQGLAGDYLVADFHPAADVERLKGGALVVIPDITSARPAAAAKHLREIGVGSLVSAPYLSDGRLHFILTASNPEAREWRADEIELIHELASRVYARIERARAEESVRKSEGKYRTLFESMDEGYCIIEVIFDNEDRPVDYRFVEVNSAFERQAGMQNVTGKRMLEFVANIESHWLENYGRVAKSGQPIRFANEYKGLHRWFDVYAFRPSDALANHVAVLFTDITSRVRVEETLRESSEFNQDVIDSIAAHIAVLDNNGEITAVNEAWRQFAVENGSDWTMGNISVRANYLDVCRTASGVNAEEASAIYKGIQMVLNGETDFFSIEYPCHSPENKRWFLLTVSPLTRTGGGAVVSHQNVTERRLAEQQIRESEARFRMMADNAPVMIWVSDPMGNCTFLSQSWYKYTGREPGSGLGKGWVEAIHPDDREAVESVFMEANDKCLPFTTEYRFANATGEYHWAIDSAQPRFDASGNYLGYIGSVVDIHERKLAEQAIVKAERRAAEEYQLLLGRIVPLAATLGRARDLTTIYRAVRDFMIVSMPCSGFFVSFFEAERSLRHAAYVWGQGEEIDISELPPMELKPEGGGANSRAVFEKRTIITNDYWAEMSKKPHVILRRDGRDPLSSLIVPMMLKDTVMGTIEVQAHENEAYAEDHAVALEMAANLAAVAIENVRLIETEGAMREAAEAANRAKDEFLSVLSHELRTPLNAMLGWVRMLKADVLDEENSARALEVIERNTRLQSSLIEDLLDVSRIISGKMRIETEIVDLVSVVETVSETIRPLAEAKGVLYRVERDDEAVFLNADTVRLQQVVSNLLQNAIKFTPTGGEVAISIERTETHATLSIQDTGVGIEAELLPFIFDRFRQADASARRNFTGLGLGLTIVRNIVELHSGSIDVTSDGKDRGSTFIVTLPLSADFYTSEALHEDELVLTGSLEGKAILIVDDDAENLTPIKIFLENERAQVTPAMTAREALRYLAEQEFHLMITDIGMPEMDGYELVAELRKQNGRNSGLKTIALTAYASVDDRDRALRSGFHAHVAKPVNFDELLEAIEKVSKN